MKISGNIQISNWKHPGHQGSSARSSLTIGKHPTTQEIYIVLLNSKYKEGTKYKVANNIEKLFTRCLDEGKVTIRFSDPAHNMSIKCEDKVLLMAFLQTLKLAIDKKPIPSTRLSCIYSGKVTPKPKMKMTISCKTDYPYLEGFPRTLQELNLNGIEMKSVEPKVLRLCNLKCLNLSDNCLNLIPEALGNLPSLVSLNLSHNNIGCPPNDRVDWTWLKNDRMKTSLRLLDLSYNNLKEVPIQVSHLRALVNLKLNNNLLQTLPANLGHLSNLRYLSISGNCLTVLPSTMQRLKLDVIDVSGNCFHPILKFISTYKFNMPSLIECAARSIVNKRIKYDGVVPNSVAAYLDGASYCVCGSACFQSKSSAITIFNVKDISATVVTEENSSHLLPREEYLCTPKCMQLITYFSLNDIHNMRHFL